MQQKQTPAVAVLPVHRMISQNQRIQLQSHSSATAAVAVSVQRGRTIMEEVYGCICLNQVRYKRPSASELAPNKYNQNPLPYLRAPKSRFRHPTLVRHRPDMSSPNARMNVRQVERLCFTFA